MKKIGLLLVLVAGAAMAQETPDNDGSYVSPQFGYSLGWDEDWQVERSVSRPGFDALELSNGVSAVVLSATTRYAGSTGFIATPQQCAQLSLRAVKPKPGTTPSEDVLRRFALDNGPAYAHPRAVWFVPELPLAGTNKIDRKALVERAAATYMRENGRRV